MILFYFLKDYSQVSVALGLFNIFSIKVIKVIKVKRCVKYLGVDIFRSGSDHLFRNLLPILDQIKQILCCWLQRDLTIYGRVLLTKAEGISHLVYPALSLYVDTSNY